MEAVKQDAEALAFADPELGKDKEIVFQSFARVGSGFGGTGALRSNIGPSVMGDGVEIRPAGGKGLGAFATQPIAAGAGPAGSDSAWLAVLRLDVEGWRDL